VRSSRARFIAAAGAVLAVGRRRPAGAQPALRDISVGLIPPGSWPSLVARELDLYRHYRLNPDPIMIGSVAAGAQQLVAGSLDVAEISSTQIIQAVQGGATIRYVSEEYVNPPYAMLGQKDVKRYADLKGKLVIIGGVNDITKIFAQRMLASDGVKPTDVDFTYAGSTADRYAALKSGSVAAAILTPPFSFRAADEGYNVIGTLKAVVSYFPFVGWTATDAYAGAHADILVDFIKAELRAAHWLNDPANKARAIDILVRGNGVPLDTAQKSYDAQVARERSFPDTGVTSPKTFAIVIDALAELKQLTPPLPPPAKFFDNRYVNRAIAELAREPR
jgi:NitT/TauT family transport system substrate-binding protein